jgi:hypothetical protein
MEIVKRALDFLKTNWITLGSGVVALAAIAVAVLGMMDDGVTERMKQIQNSASAIQSLQSTPQNQTTINNEKERGQKFEAEFTATLRVAENINRRQPLMEGVFPEPAQLDIPYAFQEKYEQRFFALADEMQAGTLPTEGDLADEAERLREEIQQKKDRGELPDADQPGPTGTGRPDANEADVIKRRAAIRKARGIRLYADPQRAFHISPIVLEEEAPAPRDMWYAQVGLWVQEDVTDAIRKLNEEAAERLGNVEPNVGNLPVKHLLGIRVLGYLTADETLVSFPAVTRAGTGQATGTPIAEGPLSASFTGRTSNNQFDVVRFTVQVVVDERDLLKLIDRITRENFYQLVGITYVNTGSDEEVGYLYGADPVVQATLDFEGYMARKVFKEMMPAKVLEELGISTNAPAGGQQRGRR